MKQNRTSLRSRCAPAFARLLRLSRRSGSAYRRIEREDEGSQIVEMALVCSFIVLPMLFGIFEFALGMYTFNFVSDAAKKATRYAAVRGAESCVISSTFPDCNLSDAGASNPTTTSGQTTLQNYVQSLHYPGLTPSNMTVTATWWSANVTNPGDGTFSYTDWNTSCTSATGDLNGNPCNTVGDAVKVVVSYPFTLAIPFLPTKTIPIQSTSEIVISE